MLAKPPSYRTGSWAASTASPPETRGKGQAEPNPADRKALRNLHQTLKKITVDFETRWHFNTCIASIMELHNLMYAEEPNISTAVMPQGAGDAGPDAGAVRGLRLAGDLGRTRQ